VAPLVVSAQVNGNISNSLTSATFRSGSDLIFRPREKPAINAGLLNEWKLIVLRPDIAETRLDPRLMNKETMLLMENYSVDMPEAIFQRLSAHHMKIFIPKLDTTTVVQCNGWSRFALVKKELYCELPRDSDGSGGGFIRRIFSNLRETVVPHTARAGFVYILLRYGIHLDLYLQIFNECGLPGSERLFAVWRSDHPVQELSARRWSARFELTNREKRMNWTKEKI
jgi:hypothetical protein